MPTTMNCSSITDYILKLERENRELQSLCDEQGETIRTLTFNEIDLKKQVRDLKKKSPETYEESRNKIEQLKNLLNKANQEKVSALNSLYDAYACGVAASPIGKSCPNQGIVDRLLENFFFDLFNFNVLHFLRDFLDVLNFRRVLHRLLVRGLNALRLVRFFAVILTFRLP